MKTHFILYVADQQKSTAFYCAVLGAKPTLDVPGMTEFSLHDGCVLGLMPEQGIKKLLGNRLPDPTQAHGIPRAELYLHVDDPALFYKRSIENGAKELSPVDKRDWGDVAGYTMDPDGHVIAFAKTVATQPKPFKLPINDSYFISDITPADKPAYVEYFKEKQIYDQTLAIPFPYTQADADWWINHIEGETRKQGRSVNWAIRKNEGALIGSVGYHGINLGKSHKAELGYWLAKPYWNQGIMTDAVKVVVELGFREFGLARVTANVFAFNTGSARVLEKSGFQLEGVLRKSYKKDGKIFDGKLYAKINPKDQTT